VANPDVAKAGGLHIRRCQGFAVAYYGCTLGALAIEPSNFCNIGVAEQYISKFSGRIFLSFV
jgi:hypothetical protein